MDHPQKASRCGPSASWRHSSSAGAISPAMSAAPVTKAKVKKIARKVAKQQINKLVPGMIAGLAVSKSTT
jgi:hypothetical protein